MPDETSITMDYIKLQWDDIHHSRLQDWSYIGVIAGVLYAIVNVQNPGLRIGLSMLGLLSSALGAYMAWEHYHIFMDKLILIGKLERKIGIQYPARASLIPVQILIVLLFVGIASAFVGMALYFWSEVPGYIFLQGYAMPVGLGCFLVPFAIILLLRSQALKKVSFGYNQAYFAESAQLESCLDQLGGRPLKLIAGERWSGPGFREIPWDQPAWTYSVEKDAVVKPLLLNHQDSFQFSLANASSKQDWHYHTRTFEIYVSEMPMCLEYQDPTAPKSELDLNVQHGVLIVPPGLIHKITLSGATFVFQAMIGGKNLGEDKIIIR